MEGPKPMLREGKKYEKKISNSMRENYHVLWNTRGFMINTISDPGMQMSTLFLACKLMRKFQAATVPAYVMHLVGQYKKGVCFNWAQNLCNELLANICKAQDQGRPFYYSWLLFLIALVAWEAPEESVLPKITSDMCEGACYASLWDSKDAQRIKDNQVFWVLF